MGDSILLAAFGEKLNFHQGHLNNMIEITQNLNTSEGESGDILTFDGTFWRASANGAQTAADGAVTAANTAQARADAAHVTLSSHATDIAVNTAKVSCPVWVPTLDPGYAAYTVATGATDFANMVTLAPNNIVASTNTPLIKMFSNTTNGNNYLEVKNRDDNNVLIGDPNNTEGTDNVEITFTLSIPISGVTKIVIGTGGAPLASINGGAFSSLSGTSSHIAVNTLYDSPTTISLRSIAIKKIVSGANASLRWNYIKVNDVLLVDGTTPAGLTYSESYIANAIPSANIAAIASNTAAIAAKVSSPVWLPTLDPGYAPYTVLHGANDFENMVTYGSNVTLPNANASTLKMFDNTTSAGSYAEFRNAVADGNDNVEVTFTLVTPITEVTKIVVGTGNVNSASINGEAFVNVTETGQRKVNTLYDNSATPINLTSITLKRNLNNATGSMFWAYIKVNDVLLVRNQIPVGLNYVIDTYVDNALPSATEAAITANTAKVSCPVWVPATDPSYVTQAELATVVPALGTAGQVLTVNSGATAAEWAAPSGGGPEYAHYVTTLNMQNFHTIFRIGQSTLYTASDVTANGGTLLTYNQKDNPVTFDHANGKWDVNSGKGGVFKIECAIVYDLQQNKETKIRLQIFKVDSSGNATTQHGLNHGMHLPNNTVMEPDTVRMVTTLALTDAESFYLQSSSISVLNGVSNMNLKIKGYSNSVGYETQIIITRLHELPPIVVPQPSNEFDFRSASIQTNNVFIGGTQVGVIVRDGNTQETTVSSIDGLVGSTNEYFQFNPTWALKQTANDSLSIEMFFKLTGGSTQSYNSIFNAFNGSATSGSSSTDNFSIERHFGNDNIQFFTNFPHSKLITNESPMPGMNGVFAHMVFIYEHANNGRRHIYLNGVETNNSQDDAGLWSYFGTHTHMNLGRTPYSTSDNGIEFIRYFRHYNVVLTPQQITILYNNRLA